MSRYTCYVAIMTRNDSTLAGVRSPSSARAFGFTLAAVASIFMLLSIFSNRQPNMWLAVLVAALAMVSWMRPALLEPANQLWLAFGQRLHKVTSLVILGAMFFLIVTPIAMVLRALGSDRLALKRAPASGSYWMQREPAARMIDFDRPF